MKKVMLLLGCLGGTLLAQNVFSQRLVTDPRQTDLTAPGTTNAAGTLASTNSAVGATSAIGDLDAQLSNLKSDLERTLPMLSAVISQGNASVGTPSTSRELANAASNWVAHALGRGANETNSLASGQNSPRTTNFAGFLRGLIRTNAAGATEGGLDANTLAQLSALQNHLQPALTILDGLNVSAFPGSTNRANAPLSTPLAPTGR